MVVSSSTQPSDHVANEARLLATLDESEQEQLAGLLRRLLTSLGDVLAGEPDEAVDPSGG